MAEGQQASAINAAFPTPPPFYKNFTEDNVQRLAALQADSSAQPSEPISTAAVNSLLNLPAELRYLLPPPTPTNGKYHSFGEEKDLYSQPSTLPDKIPPTPAALLRLTRSILLNFLELLHNLATNPNEPHYFDKWHDLHALFADAHAVINAYRPFQARESLIGMMEEWVERSKREEQAVADLKIKVESVLKGLGEGAAKVSGGADKRRLSGLEENERAHIEEERQVWEFMREGADI